MILPVQIVRSTIDFHQIGAAACLILYWVAAHDAASVAALLYRYGCSVPG